MIRRIWVKHALLAASFLFWLGCTDDGGEPEEPVTAEASAPTPAESGEAPQRYAIATAVSDDTGANTYVKVFSSFEPELDLSSAREFAGWSDMGTVGPFLFVSSGEAPTVQRFRIGERGELVDDGELGFGSYVDDASFYAQTLVNETKAYLVGNGEYVVWDPSALEITGTFPYPDLPERDGIVPHLALDRGAVVRDGRLYHAVSWSDTEELNMLPDSRIVVIDTETDSVVDVISVPCPDLNVADRDEAGNLYFSNWVYTPGSTLLMGGAKACAVRIPAGSEQLDDWRFGYEDVTGHEGATLGYLGGGQWLFSTFMNDPAAYDPQEDWFDWLFGNTWQLHVLDPGTLAAEPVAGVPENGGGYYASRLDGTTHVLIPGDGYASTTVYAIEQDGVARKELETTGWATRLFEVP